MFEGCLERNGYVVSCCCHFLRDVSSGTPFSDHAMRNVLFCRKTALASRGDNKHVDVEACLCLGDAVSNSRSKVDLALDGHGLVHNNVMFEGCFERSGYVGSCCCQCLRDVLSGTPFSDHAT